MHRRRVRLLAAVAMAITSVSCAGDDDTGAAGSGDGTTTTVADPSIGPPEEGPGGFRPEPIAWEACGDDRQCAGVSVPLDYDEPDGARLRLFVLRTPATGERLGALFVNPGGPGANATEFASILPLLLPGSITEHFDIVGVDPRGTGGSGPIDCGPTAAEIYAPDPTIEDAADRDALLAASEAYADACALAAGDLLPHLGTRDVARDLDAVRAAMGDAQLSYLGASYGTAIGQVYAELFPRRLRSMVLDGVLELGPAGLDLAAEQANGFELALTRFAAHCESSGDCRTGADPRRAITEVLAAAEAPGGIPAPDADRPAGPSEANLGLAYALYSRTLWTQLDDAVADALDGDGSGLVGLADGYLDISTFDVYFGVNCIDFSWPTDPDAFLAAGKAAATVAPLFGEALVTDYVRCAYWPVPAEPLTAVTAPEAPPILVISTTGDPATPYEAGVRVAERLERGVLLTHEGDGHGVVGTGDSCVDALMTAYLLDGTAPRDGQVCR